MLLQNEIPEAVNLAIASRAKAAGARVWLNAAPARPLGATLVDLLDLLIVNRVEAAFYDGPGDAPEVLTTLGAEGASFRDRHFPGNPVHVISTHGAGDMFVGALAAQVVGGAGIADAIGFAQAAAALHVASEPDARSALTPGDVKAFLAGQPSR